MQLKNWNVRVAANDPMIWSYTKAFALVENNTEQLEDDDLNTLLDDAYVPRDKLENPALLKWFNETDAWWFDNLRFNAEHLEPYKRALALTAGMMTGDYVLSFNEQTRDPARTFFAARKSFVACSIVFPNRTTTRLRNKSTQSGRAKLRRGASSHGSPVSEIAGSGYSNDDSARSDRDLARRVVARRR